MRLHSILLIFVAFFSFSACKKDATYDNTLHASYAGLIENKMVVYEAMDIYHDDDSDIHDTSTYLLKTVIGEPYLDNQGRSGYEYLRYRSFDNGQNWSLKDVWTVFINNTNFEKVEENERVVRLIFPPVINKSWDLNAYNVQDERTVYYEYLHEKLFLNGSFMDSTLMVKEDDFFSLVDYRRQYEIYAKDVGLVKKVFKDLTIQGFDTLQVKRGRETYLTMLYHGFE
ncbi:MAG: hypothetical protein N4A41_09980 [Crocinitomicaceae bacterium]|jgi:hypothetical protein|nr:hypothetical protein [Crocinitomicaceae bacterium]